VQVPNTATVQMLSLSLDSPLVLVLVVFSIGMGPVNGWKSAPDPNH